MIPNNIILSVGRSLGKKALINRIENLSNIAISKRIRIGWGIKESFVEVFIENENRQRIFEDAIFGRTITIKTINSFYDILEEEMKKY